MTREQSTEPSASQEGRPRLEELAIEVSATLTATADEDLDPAVESVLARIGDPG